MQNTISRLDPIKKLQHAKASPKRPAFAPQDLEDAEFFAAQEKYTAELSCEIYKKRLFPLKIRFNMKSLFTLYYKIMILSRVNLRPPLPRFDTPRVGYSKTASATAPPPHRAPVKKAAEPTTNPPSRALSRPLFLTP